MWGFVGMGIAYLRGMETTKKQDRLIEAAMSVYDCSRASAIECLTGSNWFICPRMREWLSDHK